MSTTTVRLSEELKSRVARAAAEAGTTAHAFIVEAIAEKTDMMERRAGFHAQAEERMARFAASGKAVAWDDMRRYLRARAAGKKPARPKARKL
jgi:predicted transcriptional regulator